MDLTQEIILQHGRSSLFKGQLKNPTISAEVDNPLCGDSLKIDIKIENGSISDIAFDGQGCLISQAAASLLIGKAKQIADIEKIKKFDQEKVFKLLGFKPTLSRISCAILVLEALKKALK